jgi:hypothetical protein
VDFHPLFARREAPHKQLDEADSGRKSLRLSHPSLLIRHPVKAKFMPI